jgi:hypothetical protein
VLVQEGFKMVQGAPNGAGSREFKRVQERFKGFKEFK